jgi:hypothetical protein
MLLDGLETEARLTLVGRIVARRDLATVLATRLRLVRDRTRHPAIAHETIERPLFVVGLPRTGSTLLHHLLAQDPASRSAQAWEVMYPSPPPERERYASDRRIAKAARALRQFDRMTPAFKTIHPLGARLPLECIAFTAGSFLSRRFPTMYRLPGYEQWLKGQDMRPAYEFHQRFLQQLQWRAPGQRWVLKSPSHLLTLDALFQTYPDAVIVQTHRDPLTVLASVASLTLTLQGTFCDRLDPVAIGSEMTELWAEAFEHAVAVREKLASPHRFLDVHYHELVADPMGSVRRIYDAFDMRLSADAAERMRLFLSRNPKDRHGAHRYSLATFGLDPEYVARRYRTYCEYFGVQRPTGTRSRG